MCALIHVRVEQDYEVAMYLERHHTINGARKNSALFPQTEGTNALNLFKKTHLYK
jgi:hypothetical protein